MVATSINPAQLTANLSSSHVQPTKMWFTWTTHFSVDYASRWQVRRPSGEILVGIDKILVTNVLMGSLERVLEHIHVVKVDQSDRNSEDGYGID